MENKDLLQYYILKQHEVKAAADDRYLFILDYLSEYGPMSINNLVLELGFNRVLTVQILTDLLKGGLVSRQESSGLLTVSSSGKQLLADIIGVNDTADLFLPQIRNISGDLCLKAVKKLTVYFAVIRHAIPTPHDLVHETILRVLESGHEFKDGEDFLRACFSQAQLLIQETQRESEKSYKERSDDPLDSPQSKNLEEREIRGLDEGQEIAREGLSADEWNLIATAGAPASGELSSAQRVLLHRARQKLAKIIRLRK